MDTNQKDKINTAQKKQDGFTLIELMITIFILLVGFLAMALMQVMAMNVNAKASRITESTILAQTRIEELMALPYTDPALDPTDYVKDEEASKEQFTVYRKVTEGTLPNTRQINIKVEWKDMTTKTTTISCIKARIVSF